MKKKSKIKINNYIRLGVNIDHVATIRNARGASHPDPIKAAKIAESSGADGITAHLREDRRHISDMDIKILKPNKALNSEGKCENGNFANENEKNKLIAFLNNIPDQIDETNTSHNTKT